MILVHLLFAASWIPQQAPVVKPERVLAIYDVIDLVGESAEGGQWPFDPDALEPALPVAPKRHALTVLGEAVCAHIQPALEPGLDEVQQTGDGSLVVLARPEQQAWVQAFLERQRAVTDELVDVQVRTLEGPRGWGTRRPRWSERIGSRPCSSEPDRSVRRRGS